MVTVEEFKVRDLLSRAKYYWENKDTDQNFERLAKSSMDQADFHIRANIRAIPEKFNLQLLVMLPELAITLGNYNELARRYMQLYFQYPPSSDQFHVRALLLQARLTAAEVGEQNIRGEDSIERIKAAMVHITAAIEIVTKNKVKYQALIYNLSVVAWNILRPMIRNGFAKNFIDYMEKVSALLEETDDFDFSWRIRWLQGLANCYVDADRRPDSQKALDKLWELTKKKGNVTYQDQLWRMRVTYNKDNSGTVGSIRKDAETQKSDLSKLLAVTQLKAGGIADKDVEKELNSLIQSSPGVDALAEATRVTLKYNLMPLTHQLFEKLASMPQPKLRARLMLEFSRAEVLVRESGNVVDPATGMKLNPVKLKQQEADRRVKAIRIVDGAMVATERLGDPEVMAEGCTLIWNIGKLFLTETGRANTYKPFQTAANLLEKIDSPLHELRIVLHLEMAKHEIKEDFLAKAESNLAKCWSLDNTLLAQKLGISLTADEDPTFFSRPIDKVLSVLMKKLTLKNNIYNIPDSPYDRAYLELENARNVKAEARVSLLQKALAFLLTEPAEIEEDWGDLVQEEIKEKEVQERYRKYKEFKFRHLVMSEVADCAYDGQIFEVAQAAAEFCLAHEWDPVKEPDLVAAQANCHFVLAQCCASNLLERELEIGFEDLFMLDEDPNAPLPAEEREDIEAIEEEDKEQILEWKNAIPENVQEGCKKALSIQQGWLCYNGAIHIWNIFLPVFQTRGFEKFILKSAQAGIYSIFECLNQFLDKTVTANPGQNTPVNKGIDPNLPNKITVYSELGVALLKLLLDSTQTIDLTKVCEWMLQKPLGSDYRKMVEALKAKGNPNASKAPPSKGDKVNSEVISTMEAIDAAQSEQARKEGVKKAYTALSQWNPNDADTDELELHVELWTRLGRQCLEKGELPKLALKCGEFAMLHEKKGYSGFRRVRWYSLAEFLSGEVLSKLVKPETQDLQSQNALRRSALIHFNKAASMGATTPLNALVMEPAKAFFNTILDMPASEFVDQMIQMSDVLVQLKDKSDPDFNVMFIRALLEGMTELEYWVEGERVVDSAFAIVPAAHQRLLWETKMLYLVRQDKDVMMLIKRTAESEASLQAKVWLKYARLSTNMGEKQNAYSQAVDILRNAKSVECVDIMVEWSSFKQSLGEDSTEILHAAADTLLEYEVEGDGEEGDSVGSGSHISGKSKASKMSKVSRFSKMSKMTGKSMRSKITVKSRFSKTSRRSGATKRSGKTKVSRLTSQMAEEAVPDRLNVTHYDRLFRIYVMLSELATHTSNRKDNMMLAHQFLNKIFAFTVKQYNVKQENPEQHIKLPETLEEWQTYEFPEKLVTFCREAGTNRDVLCPFAFSKVQLTHYYLRLLLSWLDEYYSFRLYCIPVLLYLQLFSDLILNSPPMVSVYKSWMSRIKTTLGDTEATMPELDTETDNEVYRECIAEELTRRQDYYLASQFTKSDVLLGEIYGLKGMFKEAVHHDSKALAQKSISVLERAVEQTSKHLIVIDKYQEANELVQNTLKRLIGKNLNENWMKCSLLLELARINILETKNPLRRRDEILTMKSTYFNALLELLDLVQNYGHNSQHIRGVLKIQTDLLQQINTKLCAKLSDEKVSKRGEQMKLMKDLLQSCLQSEILAVQVGSPFSTEPRKQHNILKPLVMWRLGELEFMDSLLHKEYFEKRMRDKSKDVISKYLEEMSRHITEEKQDSGIQSRATRAMEFFTAAPVTFEINNLTKIFIAQGHWLLATEEDQRTAWEIMEDMGTLVYKVRFNRYLSYLSRLQLAMASCSRKVEKKEEEVKEPVRGRAAKRQQTVVEPVEVPEEEEKKPEGPIFIDLPPDLAAQMKALSYWQFSAHRKYFLNLYKKVAPPYYKEKILLNMVADTEMDQLHQLPRWEEHLQEFQIWKMLNHSPDWTEVVERIPNMTAVLTLQYSEDMSEVQCGIVAQNKERVAKYWTAGRRAEDWEREHIVNAKEKMRTLKNKLYRTPINSDADLENLNIEATMLLDDIKAATHRLTEWLEAGMKQFLDTEEVPEEGTSPQKKPPAAAGKKPDDVDAKPPASGITSLILCIDQRIAELPFECVSFFNIVPIITRDFSPFNFDFRLTNIGQNSVQGSNQGLPRDSLKYCIEAPLEPEAQTEHAAFVDKLNKGQLQRYEGSPDASPGEWQRLCSKASLFLNVANETVTIDTILGLSSSASSRAIIHLDRFNTFKRFNRQGTRQEEPLAAIFSMTGTSSIIMNNWSLDPLTALSATQFLAEKAAANMFLGLALYNYKNQADLPDLLKLNFIQYGVPLLKIS